LLGVTLLGACSGVIGCFAVLRRRSLVGDAISHATLPGVCLAFLIAGEKQFSMMLFGAFISGLLGIGALALLKQWTRIKEDAAIALVLSVFFGAGVVLASIIQQKGGSGRAGWDAFIFGKSAGIVWDDVKLIALLVFGTIAIVTLCYKEFKLVTFDPEFALVQGWPARRLDFALMLLLVVAVVVGLPAVGILMMAAMLIIPAAAARFWTYRLAYMILLSGSIGALSGCIGTFLSDWIPNMPTGPCIILVATAFFFVSFLCAPERGFLARKLAQHRDRQALLEDLRTGQEPVG
jgi:manganese/zinc/iron transport system permease protein